MSRMVSSAPAVRGLTPQSSPKRLAMLDESSLKAISHERGATKENLQRG